MLCDQILTDTTYFYLVQPFKLNFSDQFPALAKSTQQFKFSKIQIVLPISCKCQNTLESVNSILTTSSFILFLLCVGFYIFQTRYILSFVQLLVFCIYSLFIYFLRFYFILFLFTFDTFFSSRNLVFRIEIIFFSPENLLLVFFFLKNFAVEEFFRFCFYEMIFIYLHVE